MYLWDDISSAKTKLNSLRTCYLEICLSNTVNKPLNKPYFGLRRIFSHETSHWSQVPRQKNYQDQNSAGHQSKPDRGTKRCRSGALPSPAPRGLLESVQEHPTLRKQTQGAQKKRHGHVFTPEAQILK